MSPVVFQVLLRWFFPILPSFDKTARRLSTLRGGWSTKTARLLTPLLACDRVEPPERSLLDGMSNVDRLTENSKSRKSGIEKKDLRTRNPRKWLFSVTLSRFDPICPCGFKHIVEIVGTGEEASKKFPRVHRVFSNLQAWMKGTHRFVSVKHMQNYLNEYTFRFNRRRNPKAAFNTLLRIAVSEPARPYKRFVDPAKPFYINPEEEQSEHQSSEQLTFKIG